MTNYTQPAVQSVRIDVSGDGKFLNLRPTLSVRDASVALGVSRRVVCDYIAEKLIDAVLVGRSYRVRTASVEKLLTLGTAAVRAEIGKPPEWSAMPPRNVERDKFRARLVAQMLDRDAEQTAYRVPIV